MANGAQQITNRVTTKINVLVILVSSGVTWNPGDLDVDFEFESASRRSPVYDLSTVWRSTLFGIVGAGLTKLFLVAAIRLFRFLVNLSTLQYENVIIERGPKKQTVIMKYM